MNHEGTTYMVWYDPDKRSKPESKLTRAIQYYTGKYGVAPKGVSVNEADAMIEAAIPITPAKFVNKNHFYFPIPDK